MSFTISELNNAIQYWRTTNWPQDFHNAFYSQMSSWNPPPQFNNAWWTQFLNVLVQWKATRPKTKTFLTTQATAVFPSLSAQWATNVQPLLSNDISSISWSQIGSFTQLAAGIKNVPSPVFTSKFCHFLAPHIFPVIDNEAMGNPFTTYAAYYQYGQAEWNRTTPTIQKQLINILRSAILTQPGCLYHNYPWASKIIELCLIARHQFPGAGNPVNNNQQANTMTVQLGNTNLHRPPPIYATSNIQNTLNTLIQGINNSQIEIYNEFSLQHEFGIIARNNYANSKVQFERNVSYFFGRKTSVTFHKKEIDLTVFQTTNGNFTLQVAVEFKYPRNGQYPEQMYSFCMDIAFLEQLKKAGFQDCYFIAFADDPKFWSGKNTNGIYQYFRSPQPKPITGIIPKPTGSSKSHINISGMYNVNWQVASNNLQYFVIRI